MLLGNSLRKSKIMKKIEKLMQPHHNYDFKAMMDRYRQEAALFQELYDVLMKMDGSRDILKKYNATPKDLRDIASSISMVAGYYKGDYLPVALVSFAFPLEVMLANKDTITNCGFDEVRQILEVAISKL